MSRTPALIALGAALVGLGVSITAAYVHYRMLADPTYTSFCDVSATVSCTQVYASRFGTFQGVSVAVFGAIWFAFATLLSMAWLRAQSAVAESVPGYLFAGSTLGLAVVLYLGYASFVLLKLVCVLCVITYAAVIALFIVSGAATSIPMLSLPRRAAHDLRTLVATPLALVLALLWLGGSASTLAFFPREGSVTEVGGVVEATQDQRSELERFLASTPRVPLAVPNEGAKVLIVKFADYQCPACSQAYLAYKPIFEKYAASHPGQVKMVMKDYPLSNACNANVSTAMHGAACEAAVAVRLARLKNKGDELENWLYTHQQEMTPESVKRAAREIGLVTDFDQKYASQIELVKGDIALGQSLRVNQTPTFFLNGIKIDGAMAPQFFDQAIALELQRPN
jgi:uncharacterized membrane protein/protein-disulfide isomerase